MKIKKLNHSGFTHDILVVLFVLIFAIGGTAYLVGSHADTPSGFNNKFINYSPENGTVSFTHGSHNTNLVPQGDNFNPANLFEVGLTINNKSAIAYNFQNLQWNFKGGILNPSGTLTPNQSKNVIFYMSPDNPNGSYSLSGTFSYEVINAKGKNVWLKVTQHPIIFSFVLQGTPYLDYIKVINTTNNFVTLSKQNGGTNGLITGVGFNDGFVIAANLGGPGERYQIVTSYTSGQGIGLTPSSGMLPGGQQVISLEPYISVANPVGQYRGIYTLEYLTDTGTWGQGPTLYSGINLTN